MRWPAVVRLLDPCRPAAVIRLVIAAVVSAVKGVGWRWPRAHVREKGGEVMPPPLTDANSSASVVLEVSQPGIRATLDHMAPRNVFAGVLARAATIALAMSMTEVALAGDFTSQAAAGACTTTSQRPNAGNANSPAFTVAFPEYDMQPVGLDLDLGNA